MTQLPLPMTLPETPISPGPAESSLPSNEPSRICCSSSLFDGPVPGRSLLHLIPDAPMTPVDGPAVRLAIGVQKGVILPEHAADRLDALAPADRALWRRPEAERQDVLRAADWPVALVLSWIAHSGESVAVADAYEEARQWRLPIHAIGSHDVQLQLWRELETGTVTATRAGASHTRITIPPEQWRTLRPCRQGSAIVFRHRGDPTSTGIVYTDVLFSAAEIKRRWPPAGRALGKVVGTAKQETAARRALVAMMRRHPTAPRSKAEIKALPEFRSISTRMFDRAWKHAAGEAETPAWTMAGRRSKRTEEGAGEDNK